jgi:hypothetical protein
MPEDDAKSLLRLLLLLTPASKRISRGSSSSTTHPSRTPPGITTTPSWNRPRELLLTIMGVRTGGATNSFLSFLLRFLVAALLSFLLSRLPTQPNPPKGKRGLSRAPEEGRACIGPFARFRFLGPLKRQTDTSVLFFFYAAITLLYLFIVAIIAVGMYSYHIVKVCVVRVRARVSHVSHLVFRNFRARL